MARVRRVGVDPSRPESIVDQVNEVLFEVDGRVSFGEPLDPNDHDSTELAGDMTVTPAHNGTVSNVEGSWVKIKITDLTAAQLCTHNLYLEQPGGYTDEPVSGEPNCNWFVARWEHDGTQFSTWEDLRVPATGGQRGVGNPPTHGVFLTDGIASTGVWLDWFDDIAEEEMFFTAQLPHSWKAGTDIEAHVHWTPHPDSVPLVTQKVAWGLEYTWANRGETFPATVLTGSNVHEPADATLVPSRHYKTEFTDIAKTDTGAAGTISSMLVCRIFRDATSSLTNDTFTGGGGATAWLAGLMEIDFHFEVDSSGSTYHDTKIWPVDTERSPFQVYFRAGDTVNANDIELRVAAGEHIDVSGNSPLYLTLFFIKATR